MKIVKTYSGTEPSLLWTSENSLLVETTVGKIIDNYRDHSSAIAAKLSVTQNSRFNLPQATTHDINKIINSLTSNKGTGPDGIPLIFIKLSLKMQM